MTRIDNGILIAVEGIDGAGKTTQVELLTEFLRNHREEVIRSKEPTDGPWGQKIRLSAATGRMPLADEIHAFAEDRREHVRDVILPALEAGCTVVLDRYFYSTIAYQGARGANAETLADEMRAIAPEPDVVLLVDVPPEVGVARISNGRKERPNRFETLEYLQVVRNRFLQLAEQQPTIVRIEGANHTEAVHRDILRTLLEGVFKKRRCAKPWGCDDPIRCVYNMAGTCQWAQLRQGVQL